jgi:transposase
MKSKKHQLYDRIHNSSFHRVHRRVDYKTRCNVGQVSTEVDDRIYWRAIEPITGRAKEEINEER